MKKSRKVLISIRIDPDVLEEYRRLAFNKRKGYQSLIHDILVEHLINLKE